MTTIAPVSTDTSFRYDAHPMRVVFGPGRVTELPDEVAHLGLHSVLVLCSPEQHGLGHRVADLLGGRAAGVFARARMHVPIDTATAGTAEARRVGADGCVSVGGGSAIGLGKAISLQTGLPTVCVPTTYSGSEMTPIWGLTRPDGKITGRDPVVLPRTVVYDPELTCELPARMSATSGMNSLAHAVEALYAPDVSPIVALMAEESARCLAEALPRVAAAPSEIGARSQALRGSWLAGACLGHTTMSLHHKLCHVLGGLFDLPHAATHAVVLPHVASFNLPAAPAATEALGRALGGDDPARALGELGRALEVPPSLAALGLRHDDLSRVAEATLAQPYANPRPVSREQLFDLLTRAFDGSPAAPRRSEPAQSPSVPRTP